MVRLDETQNFHFPFKKNSTQPTLNVSSNKDDKTDRNLSIFAGSFFFVILLLILMDNSNTSIQNSNNTLTNIKLTQQSSIVSPQLASIIPTLTINKTKNLSSPIKVEEKQISKKVNIPSPKTPTETLIPIVKTNKVNKVTNFTKPYVVTTSYSIPKKNIETKKVIRTTPIKKYKNNSSSNLTAKVAIPKKVFAKKTLVEKPTKELRINTSIAEDLLPTQFFEAKAKAASEGKLLYLKFGAKWCLPCRQMEQTTLKDKNVKDILNKNYIQFSVDVDDFDGVNMQSYFNIKQLPAQLIFDANGNFLAQYNNFTSANKLTEILEQHSKSIQKTNELIKKEIIDEVAVASYPFISNKEETLPYAIFDKVVLKKTKDGNQITSLKNKAKNWRYTSIDFTLHNVNEGVMIIKVKETQTGKILEERNIPFVNNSRIIDTTTTEDTDTTTTNFQLDISHKKRKEKDGEYIVEVYHSYKNTSRLIGTTTIIKDGLILF